MESTTNPDAGFLAEERAALLDALSTKYPFRKQILGAQLGAFIRLKLTNPDLKQRFGGLKSFLTRYFPAEVAWQGRQGLDDVYELNFSSPGNETGTAAWQASPFEPSTWLWAATTNPSVELQFAWSSANQTLMHASSGASRSDDLVAIDKLTRADYQDIAKKFALAMEPTESPSYLATLEGSESTVRFTTLIRERGLLAKWEKFRVDSAITIFANRLVAAGAPQSDSVQWETLLRASQDLARSRKSANATILAAVEKPRRNVTSESQEIVQTRSVAIKAIGFLSEAELHELRLPLGCVMNAVRALLRHEQG